MSDDPTVDTLRGDALRRPPRPRPPGRDGIARRGPPGNLAVEQVHYDRLADALLVAAGRGDLAAFAAFYDATAAVVFGTLLRALSSAEAAERSTEDVYRRVWRSAPGFDPTVRSARSTLSLATRRALAEAVHDQITQREGRP